VSLGTQLGARYSFAACFSAGSSAIDLETGATRMIEATTIDALSSIALLIAITLLYPTKRLIHVFLDNARYHHAVLVQEWLAKPGCRIKVHYIPSYCSWLRLKARNRGELGRRSIRRLGELGRTISATRPRLSTVWGWRALACPQDANSTIDEMALGAALPFGRGCLPPL
jgi:DDE superfamily endonuclease